MQNRTMAGREWLLLMALSILWGGSFFFSEVALDELGPLSVVLGRVGIAAIALIALVYLTGRRMPASPGLWGAFLVMGALNNLIPLASSSGARSISTAVSPRFSTPRPRCSPWCSRTS